MPGQVAQTGAESTLNSITGLAVPVVASSAPTWIPGLYWIDTSSTHVLKDWNGSAWVTSPTPGDRYLALLVADPGVTGPSGGASVNVSDLLEDTTSGYARQAITWGDAVPGSPANLTNSAVITFGPYSAGQAAAVQWAAMVTSASGTSGLLLYTWTLDEIEQVSVSQDIIFPIGSLFLGQE